MLFFTGLSGSGKSTLARALMDRILEHGERTVTSLDGDVVRRNLSAGLTFSKEDRETNIRRIGWVAAEISRHGGVAVCSPIAPFDETRQQVRAMVDDGGRRVLPGARRHAAGGVRAPRPQGPLRQGPAGRDPRVHRHLLAVRGAAGCRRPGGHHRPHHRGLPRRRDRRRCATPATSTCSDRAPVVDVAERSASDPETCDRGCRRPRSASSSSARPTSAVRRSWSCTARDLAGAGRAGRVLSAGTHGFRDHRDGRRDGRRAGRTGARAPTTFRSRRSPAS